MGVEFGYAAPGTPQQNGHAEWTFAILINRACAMLYDVKFSSVLRNDLPCHSSWKQTSHSIALMKPISTIFLKGKRSILTLVQNFGEMYITTQQDNSHQAKLVHYVTPHIWGHYADSHPVVHHIFNHKTRKNCLTKDVTVIEKFSGERNKVKTCNVVPVSY